MKIPISIIHSLHSVPADIKAKLGPDMSTHGLVAAQLTFFGPESVGWVKTVPSYAEFEQVVPLFWPDELQQLLPREARDITLDQKSRFGTDWAIFHAAYPDTRYEDYMLGWTLVNTRAFYYETPDLLMLPWHDRVALLPAADLFNHTSSGCTVMFSPECYTVTTDKKYKAGTEVCTSYGDLSNDSLLAEYGFVMDDNEWDKLCLDDVILPRLNETQRLGLKANGYLGEYMLHTTGTKRSANVWIALRVLVAKRPQWNKYVNGEEDNEGTLQRASKLLIEVLEEYADHVNRVQQSVQALTTGLEPQRALLRQRWAQIDIRTRQALEQARVSAAA